jgi:hypothetical protein
LALHVDHVPRRPDVVVPGHDSVDGLPHHVNEDGTPVDVVLESILWVRFGRKVFVQIFNFSKYGQNRNQKLYLK